LWTDSLVVSNANLTLTVSNGLNFGGSNDLNFSSPAVGFVINAQTVTVTATNNINLNGSINASGALTLGGNANSIVGNVSAGGNMLIGGRVTGSVTATGSLSTQWATTISGNVSAASIQSAGSNTFGGNLTLTSGDFAGGYNDKITGSITAANGAVSLNNGQVTGCTTVPSSKSITLAWGTAVGGVCCLSGSSCTSACVINNSGLSTPSVCSAPVTGTFFPVPIPTGVLNQNLTTWWTGDIYTPYMSGSQTFGGVPFTMQTSAAGMDVIWGTSIGVFSVPSGTTYTNTATLNTNLYGASTVYTLINSAWGTAGDTTGSVTFNASNGDSYTVNLVEGVNVRDHYVGGSINTVSASYVTTNVIGVAGSGPHLDMQAFALPASFATEILSSIVFQTTGSNGTGIPFLAGATVKAISYGIDHVRLDHAGVGLTCTASNVTVTACQTPDSSGSCTPSTLGISGSVSAPTASGTVTKAFTIPAGSSSTTVSMADGTAETVSFSAGSYSIIPSSSSAKYSCWNSANSSASCSHTYGDTGFIFAAAADGAGATIPTQVAGTTSGTYYLRAVKTNTTSKACEAALAGSSTVDFSYECNNPSTCSATDLMTINGGSSTAVSRNNNGAVNNYSAVGMVFDANGNAPFTFNFSDVGLVTLHARKAAGGALLSPLSGASNSFVVAPAAFVFSGITGSPIQAGASFSATVTAVTSTAAATPNFGKESPAESVSFSLGARVAPTGTNDSVNGPRDGVVAGGGSLSWASGVATVSNLSYSEVGQITLAATLASGSYLGSGKTATGTSATVGDFVPAYFDTAIAQGCGSFTYSGQPFSLVSVTAKNTSGATTLDYSNLGGCSACSKSVTLFDSGTATNFNATNTLAASAFAKGVGISSTVAYTFPTKTTGPATITLHAVDASVTPNVTSTGHVEATALVRSGRVRLMNAYGSELLDLPVTMQSQYWDGSAWVLNTADICTGDTTSNTNNGVTISLSHFSLDPTKTCVWDSGAPGLSGSGCSAAGVLSKKYKEGATPSIGFTGDFNLWLKAPGKGNSGAVGVTATVPSWLRYNWTGTVANPAARATFGIYKSPLIYRRENY
jgi:cytoskeletal protein CcmA (bactofilin family)